MSDDKIKIGIDCRDNQYYAARVETVSGRPEVKALLRFEPEQFNKHPLLQGSDYVFSIPDDKVIIKKITLDEEESDFDLKVKFELSQRINEDENSYYFDTIPTSVQNKHLGLIIRKTVLDDITNQFELNPNSNGHIAGGEIRAVALAKGYLNFCQLSEGSLVCLADFNGALVSIVFIYQNRIIDLPSLCLEKYNLKKNEDFENCVIELKTLISFKLSEFFKDEITVPLSSLLVLGEKIDDNNLSILSNFFQLEVKKPVIHSGFFSHHPNFSEISLEKYLTALGLTVN